MIEIRDVLAKEILYDCQLPFEQLYSETAFLYISLLTSVTKLFRDQDQILRVGIRETDES